MLLSVNQHNPLRNRMAIAMLVLTCAITGCGGGGQSAPVQPSREASTTVAITINKPWTNTGAALTAGQPESITATGTLNWLTGSPCPFFGGSCTSTPAGRPWSSCMSMPPPAFTAPGLACWSLMGKIGAAGTPFEVGVGLTFTPATNGELYLGVNDNVYTDDSGTWTAILRRS